MPRKTRRHLGKVHRSLGSRQWRGVVLSALAAWNRHQVARIISAVALAWLLGATALYFAERRVNPDFATWGEALWKVWVLLFSGLDQPPKTVSGRLVTMAILILGVGTAGLFTASVASLLVERYLRRHDVSNFEMEDHLVLCNWSPRGEEMHLNPIGGEAGPLNHDDQLILLSRVFLKPSETLPTDPPIAPPVDST